MVKIVRCISRIPCLKCNKKIAIYNKTKCCKDCWGGVNLTTHGLSKHPVYLKLAAIKCSGIPYDPKWSHIEGFIEDMGMPQKGDTLRRIHRKRGFFKNNCRWQYSVIKKKKRAIWIDGDSVVYNPAYKSWIKMVEYAKEFKKEIEPSWRYSFKNFLIDMGKRNHKDKLIRLDLKKGYTKENCRWAKLIYRAINK